MSIVLKGRPTRCFVDLEALRWNFRQIKKTIGSGIKILSMVKANAYGHGAVPVANTLVAEGSDAFGVATVEEGMELRQAGVAIPVLVVAGVYAEQIDHFLQNNLTPVVHEIQTLRELEATLRARGATLGFHLEIDTGMGRAGFLADGIEACLSELKKLNALRLDGVFSHFSDAERPNERYTRKQLRSFLSVIECLKIEGIAPELVHMAKSAAVVTAPDSHFTMVRPGLALYGLYPSPHVAKQLELRPVLSWNTRVLQLKQVPSHASLGYGRTYVTKRKSLIATLPLGYADGYRRLFSNRAAVLIRGKRAPVVGRVSMDLTMVDVTDIGGVQQGDEVVLLGKQGEAVISADEMAAWSNTISYEILTSISARVPRIHFSSKEDQ